MYSISFLLHILCDLNFVAWFNLPVLSKMVYLKKFLVFNLVLLCNFLQCIALLDNVNAFL